MIDCSTWSDDARAAYLAGVIDCHSHIGARRRLPNASNRMTAPRYSISISISMIERAPVEFIAQFVNATVTERKGRLPTHKPLFEMEVETHRATKLLRAALPFLIEKREKAELLMGLAVLLAQSRVHRTQPLSTHTFKAGRNEGGEYTVLGLSKEFIAACDVIYEKAQAPAMAGRFGGAR